MLLSGQRCVVRSWRSSDAESVVLHANNQNVARQLRDRFPHPYTRTHAAAFLKTATTAERPTNFCIDVNGEAVGAFSKFNVLRFFALPFADNAASIRVLEKAGYVREGVLRSSSVKYGLRRDQMLYARINPGWKL